MSSTPFVNTGKFGEDLNLYIWTIRKWAIVEETLRLDFDFTHGRRWALVLGRRSLNFF